MTTPGEHFAQAEAAATSNDWVLAEENLSAGLRLKPDAAAARYFQLATARRHLRDRFGAADAYREAIARRGRAAPARWHLQYASMLARLEEWDRAADAYQAAISATDTPTSAWYFSLGRAYEELRRWDEAKEAYRHGTDLDPAATEIERTMLATNPSEYPGRRTHARFVARHLEEIRETAAAAPEPDEDRADVFYTYWAQGIDQAPEVAQLCHRRLRELCSGPVLCLDAESMAKLVSLPEDIDGRPGMRHAHRSGLLRLELLMRYGGTWIDADCLVTSDPAPELARLREPAGLFAFDKWDTTLRNWLLTSTPGHYLVRVQRAALHLYWRLHHRPLNYLAFHYIFEALIHYDERFAREWRATPRLPYLGTARVTLHDPIDPLAFEEAMTASFVHKLTYKRPPGQVVPDSFLGRVLGR